MARPRSGPTLSRPFAEGPSVWRCSACRNRRDARYLGANQRVRGAFCRASISRSKPWPISDLFFSRTGMDRARVQQTVDEALKGADDGELFLEYCQSESFSFDDGRLKAATFDTTQGFGLRAVGGRSHRLCPCHRAVRSRHRARRRHGAGGGARLFGRGRARPLPAPTSSSIPISIRWRPPASRKRSSCWKR